MDHQANQRPQASAVHRLLARQIRRCFPDGNVPPELAALIEVVNKTYTGFDADRRSRRSATDLTARRKDEDELRQAEDRYRQMFEYASEGMFQTTADGQYLACNLALAKIYGYESPEAMIGSISDISRQLYADPSTRSRFKALLEENGAVKGFEARIHCRDGNVIWISETARSVYDRFGNFLYFEGFVTDITARKLAEDALRESEERYALAMRGANDGLWDWNLRTGRVYFSPRWLEMLGIIEPLPSGLPEEWFNRVHADDLETLKSMIASHREGLAENFRVEYRMLHADGAYRWMICRGAAIRDDAGKVTRMAGSQTDITHPREAEEQLLQDALHDGLTGLPNRVLFSDRLERSLARISRDSSHRFAVLFLDLDRFKVINDSLGHGLGDQLLIALAHRLMSCLRPGDTVARLGGDEFTILLEDPTEPDGASTVADRVLDQMKKPFILDSHEVYVTASIGITRSDVGYIRPQDVLRDADTAMYRAKAAGKSRFQLFDADMHARAVLTLQVENDLRRAIDRNEFELNYQPIHTIEGGKLRGFEALLRWRHPERGIISPADFIPVAEETGMILPIGKWVIYEACRQAVQWRKNFPQTPLDINVNLSGKQFTQSDLVEQVMGALRESGLPARHLILEVTESVVMENPQSAIEMLQRLKDLGVQLNIDDFGTGYSSLAYLQRFPIDTMKIDRSFISGMCDNPENAEIVRTIVSLAHNLNLKVTAEGIETPEQLAQLQDLQCENAQGYYLSRPLPSDKATDLLRTIHSDQAAA
jgi:diguanylate cyclase (GGDEF)-like protein/PAS domain S-box-containing protein